ncbi:tetratricopeptide repeat-containing sulfotransferase family protein [Dokdonella sp. MW10]|uniref:tetratricopeptide repeat-containing sulfotransferase family protein n=1 Tax=Dokdonella sp. MW10 TaxID=2992926 RepID=UPI003F7E91AE
MNALDGAAISPRASALLVRWRKALAANDAAEADRILPAVMLMAPEHAQTWLLAGRTHLVNRRPEEALSAFEEGLRFAPDDIDLLERAGAARVASGRVDEGLDLLRRACAGGGTATWLEYAIALDRAARAEDALVAVEQVLRRGGKDPRAGLLRARCLQMLGRVDEAAAQYRAMIRSGQRVAECWFALVDMKAVVLSDDDWKALSRVAEQPRLPEYDAILLGFTLARALEDRGLHDEAFNAFERANERVRRRAGWDAAGHAVFVDDIMLAFPPTHEPHVDRGREVIFLVGLPRSGSTLVEEVLAMHPLVEGASELPTLPALLERESKARRKSFPEWCGDATEADWARLGKAYLDETARWRGQRPLSTDKLPDNWKYLGAIRRMLPGARIVDCRRDPVETCWSCYKQLFAPGLAGFAYSLDDLASYYEDYRRLMAYWSHGGDPGLRVQGHEALLADPDGEIRTLLSFCGLDFDERCLRPHEGRRSIRTTSSAQVRMPLRRSTARTLAYAAQLRELRQRLEALGGASGVSPA